MKSEKQKTAGSSGAQNRALLYKTLYNAAKACIHPSYQNDGEAVKAKRDFVTEEKFDKSYDKLTNAQLLYCINYMQTQTGFTDPGQVKLNATKNQLGLLRFYQIGCGIYYSNFDTIIHKEKETDKIYRNEEIRKYLSKIYESKGFLPPNLFAFLYANWINPKSHKFLEEGNFKTYTKNPNTLRYENLTPEEAKYLINRFAAIHQNIGYRVQSGSNVMLN